MEISHGSDVRRVVGTHARQGLRGGIHDSRLTIYDLRLTRLRFSAQPIASCVGHGDSRFQMLNHKVMPSGKVGVGTQNRYRSTGEMIVSDGTILRYRKGNRLEGIHRDDPPCWNAGTPAQWPDDLPKDEEGRVDGKMMDVTIVDVQNEANEHIPILATFDEQGKAVEFHPLIQFFNEVMAGIVRDGMTRDLDNLTGPTSARRLWKYLERKYLKVAESADSFKGFLDELHKEQIDDKIPEIDWDKMEEKEKYTVEDLHAGHA